MSNARPEPVSLLRPAHNLCLCQKPETEVTRFDCVNLKSAMVFHRIYHYSFGLHVNHLLFLNTYLFGLLFLVASFGHLWVFVIASLAYVVYLVLLTRLVIFHLLPYILFLFGLACAAWELRISAANSGFCVWEVAVAGVCLMLASFAFQLAGHWIHEVFNAPPSLMHGFVAAPVLEYVSLLWRLGYGGTLHEEVLNEVEAVRSRALQLHQDLLFVSS